MIIAYDKFYNNRFRDFDSLEGQNSPCSID